MSVPVLENYQYWFGTSDGNGKLFGIDTQVDVVSVDGLEALTIRSGSRDFPRSDGAIPGLHTAARKQPIFELEALGDAEYYDLVSYLNIMKNAEGQLHFKYPDREQKFMWARVLARSDFKDGFIVGRQPLTVAFEVSDPRVYGIDYQSIEAGVWQAPSEGSNWGFDWGIDFVVSGSGGSDIVVTNEGNQPAYPLIRFYGPTVGTCLGVLLQNITTDVDLEINSTILSGQILTADMDARARGKRSLIISLDGASRYGDWVAPRKTFYLAPDVDNVIRLELTGSSTSDDVRCLVNWRNTSY